MNRFELCLHCKLITSSACEDCVDYSSFHPIGGDVGMRDLAHLSGQGKLAMLLYLLQGKDNQGEEE